MTNKANLNARRLRRKKVSEARSYVRQDIPLTARSFSFPSSLSDAGVNVDERSAMAHSAVWACVKIRAESIGVMPLKVYQRDQDGGRREARTAPAWRLLHESPNPDMTPVVFKELLQSHVDTWGNAYAFIEIGNAGFPVALWPLDPSRTEPVREADGRVLYDTDAVPAMARRIGGVGVGRRARLEAGEVLHIRGLGEDGLKGYSPIGMAKQAISVGLASEKFRGRFFGNGAWMSGVFEHPGQLSTEAYDRLRKSLHEKQGGVLNAFKPLIVEEGMKYSQLRLPTEDALLLEAGLFSVREVSRYYRVPLHMLGDLQGGASYASIEQLGQEFTRYSLGRPMRSWEEECGRKLLNSARLYVEFQQDVFLRGDTAARYEAYAKGREGGWLSVNDIRRMDNLPPIEGGDEYLRPLNMGVVGEPDPVDEVEDEPPVVEEPVEDDSPRGLDLEAIVSAHRPLLEDAAGRIVRRELGQINRHAGLDPDAFADWCEGFYAKHREHLVDVIYPYAVTLGRLLGVDESRVLDAVSALADAEVLDACSRARANRKSETLEGLDARWMALRPPEMVEALVGLLTRQEV